MRVKSRNPPAAKDMNLSPPGRPATWSTSANASSVRQVADRGEYLVVLGDASSQTLAPQASQAPRTRATSAAAFSASGVSTTLRPRYSSGERRLGAAVLGARDRVPGHKAPDARAHRRARGRDHVLLGAARVGDDGRWSDQRR